jgi:hypothetical protein
MALLAARTPRSSAGRAADFDSAARGFDPHRGDHFGGRKYPAPKLFNTLRTHFKFVLARFIPVRRFAGRADPRLTDRAFTRLPLVGTAITFIPFSLERDHAHAFILLDNNILSRCILYLTNIYLSSNIFLR